MPEFVFNGKLNAYELGLFGESKGCQVIIGEFNATTAGYGIPLTDGVRTWIMRGNADDGGVVFKSTGNAYLFSSRRLLMTAVQTGNNSFFGGCDRLSVAADESAVTGYLAAHWGMLELKSGGKSGGLISGAVRGDLNIQSGSTVSANGVACFLAASENLSASTHTGRYSVLGIPAPGAGTFDCFADIAASTGATSAGGAHEGVTAALFLVVYIAGTAYYVPCLSA